MKAEETAKRYLRIIRNKPNSIIDAEASSEEPNRLSEELLQCLISIFVKLNQTLSEKESTSATSKHNLNCINSKNFSPKSTFSCKARSSITNDDGVSQGSDSTEIGFGPYKNFNQITRNSLKTARLSDSCPATKKLRYLTNSPVRNKLLYVEKLTCYWTPCQGFAAEVMLCGPVILEQQTKASFLDQHLQCLYNACTVRHLQPRQIL